MGQDDFLSLAKSVLHLFESAYPADSRPRAALENPTEATLAGARTAFQAVAHLGTPAATFAALAAVDAVRAYLGHGPPSPRCLAYSELLVNAVKLARDYA